MTHDFRQDYEALALDQRADWATARAAYRRQVNLCHPDRYAQRPRERVHAQQRFIHLTRSFDSLRNFYRANRRLPFEPIRPEGTGPGPSGGTEPGSGDAAGAVRSGAGTGAANGSSGGRDEVGRPSERAVLEAGMLGMRPAARPSRSPRLGRLFWPAIAGLLVAVTLGTFLVLDRNARRATLAEGREVLRRTAPSEFMPSASEVQKRSSRGAFIEREDSGRIGDQLMEDVFR